MDEKQYVWRGKGTSCQTKVETFCSPLTNDLSGKAHTAFKRLLRQIKLSSTDERQADSEHLQDAYVMIVVSVH